MLCNELEMSDLVENTLFFEAMGVSRGTTGCKYLIFKDALENRYFKYLKKNEDKVFVLGQLCRLNNIKYTETLSIINKLRGTAYTALVYRTKTVVSGQDRYFNDIAVIKNAEIGDTVDITNIAMKNTSSNTVRRAHKSNISKQIKAVYNQSIVDINNEQEVEE